jgi:hypothetical protein
VHVRWLREKIEQILPNQPAFVTVRSAGYRFDGLGCSCFPYLAILFSIFSYNHPHFIFHATAGGDRYLSARWMLTYLSPFIDSSLLKVF